MREIIYSSRPVTMHDALLLQKGTKGDMEAVSELILRRTDITVAELLELEVTEVVPIIEKIGEAINTSMVLSTLSKQMESVNEQ